MAQNPTRWFQGYRRVETILREYKLLKSSGSERRCQFQMAIPLFKDGQLVGAPEWMANDYAHLVKSDAPGAKIAYPKESSIGGITAEFWSTAKIRSRFFPALVGCTIRPTAMVVTGKEDSKDVTLEYTLYGGATQDIHNWVYQHKGASLWISFDLVQSELPLEDEDDEDDEDEDADNE